METIADRIEALLGRLKISGRELGRRAGLNETQVGVLIARYRKNPDAEVTVPTLQAIARGAGVSEAWLLTGRGSPDDRDDIAQPAAPEDVDLAGRRSVAADAARTSRPTFANLPGWPELLAGARAIAADRGREIPSWAWDAVAASSGLLTTPPTPAAIFDLAKVYADHEIGKPSEARAESGAGVASRRTP